MPAPTTARKQPTDRKPPATKTRPDADTIEFSHDGETYTSNSITDVITPGWIRQNRRREEIDLYMTLLEDSFADVPGAMDAYDKLSWDESQALVKDLLDMMETTVGESLRSST